MNDEEFPAIRTRAEAVAKARQPFERIVLSKEQALRMFADNPFKVRYSFTGCFCVVVGLIARGFYGFCVRQHLRTVDCD